MGVFVFEFFVFEFFVLSSLLNSLFLGGFDGKSFLAFLTIWLVKNLILIQAIAFKKSTFFWGFSGAKRGRMVSKYPPLP
ncbi:hypothetical protein HMPREF1404_01485 [Helicobacter pylori GAM210Bi]|nr:hypothetical protein HMPREF1404_01485 [Helicobacter pylori GAM210Bi]